MADPTKCLIKQHVEFREKMREIVKDFPSMRNEVGINNFERSIGDQLRSLTKECLEDFDTSEQLDSNRKAPTHTRNGPTDNNFQPKTYAGEKNLMSSDPDEKKFTKTQLKKNNEDRSTTPAKAE